MSTSLLYHAFGIRGYQYVRTDYPDGQVIFTIRQESKTCRCSACGSTRVQSRGHVERRFRSLPIGSRTTAVVLPIPRVECRACGVVRQVEVPFADPRRTYTRGFERYALELSRRMTIRDVARHLDVGWDVIKGIQKRDLSRRYARVKLKHLRRIAVGEIAVGSVTGRFKTSHSWALQNQPPLLGVSDTLVDSNRLDFLFKASGVGRLSLSSRGGLRSSAGSALPGRRALARAGSDTLLSGAPGAGGRFGWF